MAETERPEGGTKRIPSGTSSGQGMDIEEPHDQRSEGVDIIRDDRRSGNAGRIKNGQRTGAAKSGRDGRRDGTAKSGRDGRRDGNVKSGKNGQNGERTGNVKAGRDGQNDRRSRNLKAGRDGQNGERTGNAKSGKNGQRTQNAESGRTGREARRDGAANRHSRGPQGAAGQPVPPKRGKKPKRKRSGRKFLIGSLCGIILLAGLGYLVIVLFEVEKIVVTGNQYCSEEEIIEWLKQDQYSDNSLYLLWKYNQNDVEQLPAVEEAKVGLKDLRTVTVQVKEKTFSGRIDYAGKFLYFDQQGKAALVTESVIEGALYIEGMEIHEDEITLGRALPEEEGQVYEEIKEVIPLLEKQGLSPDKVSCEGADLTLHFGGIRVQIGNGKFSDRLAQVPPILEKLTEMYAGQTGVLHLENYDVSGSSIRFVPDTAETPDEAETAGPQPEGENEGEDMAAGSSAEQS